MKNLAIKPSTSNKTPGLILCNKTFNKQYTKLIRSLKLDTPQESIKKFGHCFDAIASKGIDDKVLDLVKHIIYKIKHSDAPQQNVINVINVIYSTILKRIDIRDIITKKISPERIRNLVDKSIEEYRINPINEGIDYRHILGRLVSLRQFHDKLYNLLGRIPERLKIIKWTDEDQLKLLAVHEKIKFDIDTSTQNFSVSKGYRTVYDTEYKHYTQEKVDTQYKYDIVRLMKLTLIAVKELMNDPIKNREQIEDKLEIAYTYFDKVPYGDEIMPELLKQYVRLRQEEKNLANILKC